MLKAVSIMRREKRLGKISTITSGISAGGSIISAHNVCHSVCLGAVALLSVFGIAASSDILMFLQDYNMIFWIMGIFFLLLSLILLVKFGPCISKKTILGNTGLLIVGVPFFGEVNSVLLVIGGSIVVLSFFLYVNDRFKLKILRGL